MKQDWITVAKGFYKAQRGYLVTGDDTRGAAFTDAAIEIATGQSGQRELRGFGKLQNRLIIDLLDLTDDIDIVIDLGGVYKYRFKAPDIKGGKLFTPHVEATIRFSPTRPWQKVEPTDFEADLEKITFLNDPPWNRPETA